MKPVDVKSSTNIDFDVENKKERKILNLKLGTIYKYQNLKTFLEKVAP